MRSFVVALQFLTRLPLGKVAQHQLGSQDLARSLAAFPLVGVLLGAFLALVRAALAGLGFSDLAAGVVVALAWVAATGNLHLDGLMDTADALGAGSHREKALQIMRDSRLGAHGVIAGAGALLLRSALLADLSPSVTAVALPVAAALGRWALVYGAVRFSYARPGGGLARAFMDGAGPRELVWASLWAAAVSLMLGSWAVRVGVSPVLPVAVGVLLALGLAHAMAKRWGGLTGDMLGALCEGTEMAVLAAFVLRPGLP